MYLSKASALFQLHTTVFQHSPKGLMLLSGVQHCIAMIRTNFLYILIIYCYSSFSLNTKKKKKYVRSQHSNLQMMCKESRADLLIDLLEKKIRYLVFLLRKVLKSFLLGGPLMSKQITFLNTGSDLDV